MPRAVVTRLRRDESGQTLFEYVLILAFVAILIAATLTLLQVGLEGMLEDVADLF